MLERYRELYKALQWGPSNGRYWFSSCARSWRGCPNSSTLTRLCLRRFVSAGPWLLSIISVMLIGILSILASCSRVAGQAVLVTTTYLFALLTDRHGRAAGLFHRLSSRRCFRKKAPCDSADAGHQCLLPQWWAGLLAFVLFWCCRLSRSLYRLLCG